MPVRDFPARVRGAPYDSEDIKIWLDLLTERQNIDTQQELTSVASGDELLIFDVSETGNVKTKKATVANIKTAINTGVTDGSDAATGQVGEFLSTVVLVGSGVALTTDTHANAGSLSITAGDWDVSAELWFLAGNLATGSYLDGWINTTSATAPTTPALGTGRNEFFYGTGINISNSLLILGITPVRVSISSTTTYYFGARAGFTVGMTLFGKITARRVR